MHCITLAGIPIRLVREEGKGHTMSVSSSLPHTFLLVSLCMRRRVQKHKRVGLRGMFLNPRLRHMLCDNTARMPEELCHRILNRLHSCKTHLRTASVHVKKRRRGVAACALKQAWSSESRNRKCGLSKANVDTHTHHSRGHRMAGLQQLILLS